MTTDEPALALLEEFRGILKGQGRGDDEDTVLEVMDRLTGWCSPHQDLRGRPWVGQEEKWGCGAAAVAMITGKTYAEIREYCERSFASGGMTGPDWEELLTEFGYATAKRYRIKHWPKPNTPREPWPPEPFGDIHLCQVDAGGPGSHMVVMLADGLVNDPLTPQLKRLTDYPAVGWVAAVIPFRRL